MYSLTPPYKASLASFPHFGHLALYPTQTALVEMNDSALTIDQLDALSRAVPDDQERKDIRLYLQVPTCT